MALVIFRLLDKKTDPDSFFLNEDGSKDTERKLDFTNSRGIINPFFITDKEGGRIMHRYIKGCKFFDIDQQEKEKYIANKATTLVQFEKGADIILDDKKMKPLIDWLSIHPLNPGSKHFDPDLHEPLFIKFDPKAELAKEVELVTAQDEAMDLLRDLRKDTERMKAIGLLFEETYHLTDEQAIYLGLRNIANSNPKVFVDSIASKQKSVLADILKALKYTIIQRNAKGYFYEKGSKALIFETLTKDAKAANDELVVFLMSKEGETYLRDILVKIQQEEVALNAAQ